MIGYTPAELDIREHLGLPYATGTDQDTPAPQAGDAAEESLVTA